MTDKLEQILIKHDRAVVQAGKTYDGQVSSVIRHEAKQAITALLDTEIAKAKIEIVHRAQSIITDTGTNPIDLTSLRRLEQLKATILADTESNKEGVEVCPTCGGKCEVFCDNPPVKEVNKGENYGN